MYLVLSIKDSLIIFLENAKMATNTSKKWLGDSGTSSHYSANKSLFLHLKPIDNTPVLTGNR